MRRAVSVLSALTALSVLSAPSVLSAQQYHPDSVTAADYAHAEKFLAAGVFPLVGGMAGRPTWLGDRFWYRVSNS
jgi:hypothetical protein